LSLLSRRIFTCFRFSLDFRVESLPEFSDAYVHAGKPLAACASSRAALLLPSDRDRFRFTNERYIFMRVHEVKSPWIFSNSQSGELIHLPRDLRFASRSAAAAPDDRLEFSRSDISAPVSRRTFRISRRRARCQVRFGKFSLGAMGEFSRRKVEIGDSHVVSLLGSSSWVYT